MQFGVAQVGFRVGQGCIGLCQGGLVGLQGILGGLEFVFADDFLFDQGSYLVHVHLGGVDVGHRDLDGGFGRVDVLFVLGVTQLEEELPPGPCGAFRDKDLVEITLYHRSDVYYIFFPVRWRGKSV